MQPRVVVTRLFPLKLCCVFLWGQIHPPPGCLSLLLVRSTGSASGRAKRAEPRIAVAQLWLARIPRHRQMRDSEVTHCLCSRKTMNQQKFRRAIKGGRCRPSFETMPPDSGLYFTLFCLASHTHTSLGCCPCSLLYLPCHILYRLES